MTFDACKLTQGISRLNIQMCILVNSGKLEKQKSVKKHNLPSSADGKTPTSKINGKRGSDNETKKKKHSSKNDSAIIPQTEYSSQKVSKPEKSKDSGDRKKMNTKTSTEDMGNALTEEKPPQAVNSKKTKKSKKQPTSGKNNSKFVLQWKLDFGPAFSNQSCYQIHLTM